MTETEKQWWHVYSGVAEDGVWEGMHALLICGSTTTPPEEVPEQEGVFKYVGSFDHEPTQEEKDALTPEEFLDDHD